VGYLLDNLPPKKDQIVECPKLYTLVLKVKHRSDYFAMIAGETDDTIGKIIRSVVPDPEDWQYSGRYRGFVDFRFHIPGQRSRAQEELRFKGYYTETKDELP
jgi:hypothetical protein